MDVLATLGLAAAGCGSEATPPEASAPIATVRPAVTSPPASAYQQWSDVAVDLEPGLDPRAENPCQRGDPRCLELLIAEMELREKLLSDACDHDAVFAIVYLTETEAVQALVNDGALADPETFVNLTAWFAHQYITAYDDWHFDRGGVPDSWAVVFEAARDRRLRGIGNALVAVNAHVTFDLPVSWPTSMARTSPKTPTPTSWP